MLICILKTKKLMPALRISDARIKVDARTEDDEHMAWHGIYDDVA